MRRVFAGFAGVLLLAVVVQFYLAAAGAFDAAPLEDSFEMHRTLGLIILLLAALTTIAAALARAPGKVIGLSGLIVGLVVLQSPIQRLADAFTESGEATTTASTLVFGLHALNGLAILGTTAMVLRRARGLPASRETADEGAAAPPTPGVQPAS